MTFLELEAFNDVVLIMELILVCQKHVEKSQLALCKAIPRCDLGKSSVPGQLPEHGTGKATPVFAWFHQCCCRKTKNLRGTLGPWVRQHVAAVSCHEGNNPVGSESALTMLQTPQNVNTQRNNLVVGLQGHQKASRGDPYPSARRCGYGWATCSQLCGLKDHTQLIM